MLIDGVGGVVLERAFVKVGCRVAFFLAEPVEGRQNSDRHVAESLLAESTGGGQIDELLSEERAERAVEACNIWASVDGCRGGGEPSNAPVPGMLESRPYAADFWVLQVPPPFQTRVQRSARMDERKLGQMDLTIAHYVPLEAELALEDGVERVVVLACVSAVDLSEEKRVRCESSTRCG